VTTYLIITSFLNFLAAILLAFAVGLRNRNNRLNLQFGIFAFFVALWAAAYLLWQITDDPERALFFTRVLMFPAYFVPITYLHFVTRLCNEHRLAWLMRFGYASACVFSALSFTPLMVQEVAPAMGMPLWPRAGEAFLYYLVWFGLLMLIALWQLQHHARHSSGARSSQLRTIFMGTVMGFAGAATNFPLWFDLPVPPIGNALVFLYLVMVAHAVSRYQLPLVTHDFAYAAIYVAMGVTFSCLILLAGVIVVPAMGIALTSEMMLNGFLLSIVASLFFLWAVPRMHRTADRVMAQTYLRHRKNKLLQLKALGHRIVTLGTEQEIFESTVQEIARVFNLQAAAAYSRTEFDRDYQLRAAHGWLECPAELPIDSVLTRMMHGHVGPVLIDGSEMEFSPEILADLERLRMKLPLEAVFPIASDDFVSGVLLLGSRQSGERYTEAELALLESTCLQVAVTLRARQLERRASQTEKLISLGTLAAGLAHELRNPLTSVQTFTALLKERLPDPEMIQEFGAIVERDVNRIASIVDNVAAFAESNKVVMTAVDLTDLLRTVSEIVHPELVRSGVTIEIPTGTVPPVRGNNSQLLQVFLNLTQNAIQALEGRKDGRIVFKLETRVIDVPQPLLFVSVADNGPGIDPVVLPQVFEPFATTKATGERRGKEGMGLGLAIVKRIVQHHHGDIDVDSVIGRGTTFRVHLPILE
jgi:two-component system nitrogen regulation sensor histidine kinase GlnL